MPYCIQCGVQLKDIAKQCPLCGTAVVTSSRADLERNENPPARDILEPDFDKDLWVKLVSIITVAPALLTAVIDYFLGNGIDWSIYVMSALGLVWVWCVSPFAFRRNIFPLWFAIDTAALAAFLLLVQHLSKTGPWFYPLALPLTLCVAALIFTIVTLFKRRIIHQLQKPAVIFLFTAILCLLIELIVDIFGKRRYWPEWSILVAIPLMTIAIILLILQKRPWIVEELRHWFRV